MKSYEGHPKTTTQASLLETPLPKQPTRLLPDCETYWTSWMSCYVCRPLTLDGCLDGLRVS